jgi:hypothetical protein
MTTEESKKSAQETDLIFASTVGDTATIIRSLENGADIHTGFELPLQKAAEHSTADVVRLLDLYGADFEEALVLAAYGGDLKVVKKLIAAEPELTIVKTLRAAFAKKSRPKAKAVRPRQKLKGRPSRGQNP